MPFDDDDEVGANPQPTRQSPEDASAAEEEALEDEAQDFRHFAALQRKNFSVQAIRKGEKDFESHGTREQTDALETSRRAMEEVLSYTRLQRDDRDYVRGWYFPERWATAGEEEAETLRRAEEEGTVHTEKMLKIARERAAERREMHTRDRVVCTSLNHKTLGRNVKGQGTKVPGWDQVWLLPEEALFLLERGTMDLWWPTASMAEIFPVKDENRTSSASKIEKDDEHALGFPLSLQAAYSLLIGEDGERGTVTLRNFQVYSNLNRAGYHVLRAPPPDTVPPAPADSVMVTDAAEPLWRRLVTLLFPEREPTYPAYGPIVRPGFYRSYESIYKQLALIPRYKPTPHPPKHPFSTADSPFRVQYHFWKPGKTAWAKANPPSQPDYLLAIVDAQETGVPNNEEVAALLASVPSEPPPATMNGPNMHRRLKHGHRNVLLAVVDHGLVNYLRLAEGAFGEELLYRKFDTVRVPRGGKHGGRGGRGGRVGRGGGRGRGRGRGG